MSSRSRELLTGPIRAIRRSGLLWAISLVALVAMTVAFWPSFKGAMSASLTDFLNQLPQGLLQAFGMQDFVSPAGYLRGNLYALLVPLLIAGAGVGFANSLTASEEDSGRMEVLLAQPVSRHGLFAGRAAAVFVWVAILTAATAIGQLILDPLFGLEIATDRLMAAIVLSGLLGLFHAGLALALAGIVARPSVVLGVGLFVAFAGCTVATLFPISEPLKPWAHISPWDWALAGDSLSKPTELWRYLALGLPAVGMAAVGVFAFTRRDVRAA
jgi:ABC-2 type transport system permease protein